MQVKEVEACLQQALNIDINALMKANPSEAHNLQEQWEATVGRVTEFANHASVQAKPTIKRNPREE